MLAKSHIGKVYKRWDRYLLQNHPRLWALRLPALVVYFVCFNLLAAAISLGFPLKTYHVTKYFFWLWLFGIVELIALGYWIRQILNFSHERALEKTSPQNGLVEIIAYMFCIFAFLSPTINSSVILEIRFSRMATRLDEMGVFLILQADSDVVLPQALVEKCSRVEYGRYLYTVEHDLDERMRIEEDIYRVMFKLYAIRRQENDELLNYLTWQVVLLHISVFMFSARHTRQAVVGKTIWYGAGIYIFFVISQQVGKGFQFWRVAVWLIFLFILFISMRTYWQKVYKTFIAMNVTLLPYMIYYKFFYRLPHYEYNSRAVDHFGFQGMLENLLGSFWGGFAQLFILWSPLLIAWVFIFTKSMYMRLLALPEG